LLKLKAGMAYPPFTALANNSLEFTNPKSLYEVIILICIIVVLIVFLANLVFLPRQSTKSQE
jgi:hypothetical protein